MGTCLLALALALAGAQPIASTINAEEKQYQEDVFERWWGTELVWRFEDLPEKGSVPEFRVPYSGFIYPDASGGVAGPIRKYDQAFNGGRLVATAHEHQDTTAQRETTVVRGRFGIRRYYQQQTPGWHGHCNGWTAAAIRHAAPRQSVVRNGVVFTPADIKGLLAEIYMYNRTEFLGGVDFAINPGVLHAVITNWIGRGSHPLGMDRALGEEVWNYPVYAYASSSARRSPTQVEVKMNVAYALNTSREFDAPQHLQRIEYFHYLLELNENEEIIGGRYLGNSSRINMLWAPLRPVASGTEGNELGNPYIDVEQVLAMWRESVPEELRNRWLNIDPTEEDRVAELSQE